MAQVQRGDQALRHTSRSIHPCAHILLVTFVCVPPASPPSAYYHCLITATTIGYGDVPISTNGGKWFASLHMMVSVSLVAELLASIQKIRADRTVLLRRAHMLMLRLDDIACFVEYVHIAKDSARVQEGDVVSEGDIICLSGGIGFCPKPHLHFQAHYSDEEDAPTVPFCFRGADGSTFVPVAGEWYTESGHVGTQASTGKIN